MDTEPAEGTDDLIYVMPAPLANQIAAGEVVQRPASVAKECIENALDAGADSIELIIKKAGSELVQVVDNGCGMSPTDARRCFQRHATSKIRELDDLERIRTLGFRGEALASIAAVAQVELRTKRPEDDVAHCVEVEGSEVKSFRPCASPNGTSIAVKNIFFNVPARRNFLKTPATEFKHLTETFQKLALSNPDVAFRMVHNGNEIYRLQSAQGDWEQALSSRVVALFGERHADELLWVDDSTSYVSVDGVVGIPEFHRRSRDYQFLFVNGRAVQNRYLSHAVRRAYADMIPDGAFPFFALFLSMDPARVDVNVHPAKEEVKFDDQQGLYAFLRSAVRDALASDQVVPQFEQSPSRDAEEQSPHRPSFSASPRSGSLPSSAPNTASNQTQPQDEVDPHAVTSALYGTPTLEAVRPGEDDARREEEGDRQVPRINQAWQVGQTFVIVPDAEGLLVIDQFAAHKRVIFERIRDARAEDDVATQALLFPETIEISASAFHLFEEIAPVLQQVGFDAEPFGDQTVVLRGVPAGVDEEEAGTILKGVLGDLEQERTGQTQEEHTEKIARTLASRQAIQRGEALAEEEMRSLVQDLFACQMPYSDPQGNPVLFRLSRQDLTEMLHQAGT